MPSHGLLNATLALANALFLVVAVAVYLYIKHKGTGIPTQTQTTPQVAPTGQPDSTGGGAAPIASLVL
jgi:hypothetical protein